MKTSKRWTMSFFIYHSPFCSQGWLLWSPGCQFGCGWSHQGWAASYLFHIFWSLRRILKYWGIKTHIIFYFCVSSWNKWLNLSCLTGVVITKPPHADQSHHHVQVSAVVPGVGHQTRQTGTKKTALDQHSDIFNQQFCIDWPTSTIVHFLKTVHIKHKTHILKIN